MNIRVKGSIVFKAFHSTTKFDPARMRQVLTNLLSNAVQHCDPDSPVVLEVSVEGDNMCCEVRNRGTPIRRTPFKSSSIRLCRYSLMKQAGTRNSMPA